MTQKPDKLRERAEYIVDQNRPQSKLIEAVEQALRQTREETIEECSGKIEYFSTTFLGDSWQLTRAIIMGAAGYIRSLKEEKFLPCGCDKPPLGYEHLCTKPAEEK